ncbi:MAG TPA: carboxylating nicotinate-nucleotide diphosphorylase [bacterium]|nr:carboxylating nicotinate-nucleotide diphosphorylase [bacterium]
MKDLLRKYSKEVDAIIDNALREDIGPGDITTDMIVPEKAVLRGVFKAKDIGVLCGLPIAKKVFLKLDKKARMTFKKKDGDRIKNGDILGVVRGSARALLTGERLALNILQRLSGIATVTKKFVEIARPYKVAVLDTRKTTPNLRILEKYAVKTGGGENHRMGLYDAVLIKDNHLKLVDLDRAMTDLRRFLPGNIKIEIEVDSFEMLEKAISVHPDIIMLDNMTVDMMEKAVARIRGSKCRAKIEVSGGVNMHTVGDIARLRVDYVSIGSVTHSPQAIDISFKFDF